MSGSNGSNGHTDFVFSIVRGIADETPADTTFRQFMAEIRDGRWREEVEELRKVLHEATARAATAGLTGKAFKDAVKNATRPIKTRLPGACFSGTFSYRDAEHLQVPSGLICADLDDLNERVESVRDIIAADPHTLGCAISPSGTGLKVVFRIDPTRPHLESFRAAKYFVRETFGLDIDSACKDINRLCFVTYDPDAFIADDALVLPYPAIEEIVAPPAVTLRARVDFPTGFISPGDDFNARGDWRSLLKAHGWKEETAPYWCRPGKDHGISASWDVYPDHFHVFTDAAPPLQEGNYRPFALYAFLQCGGDFQRASDELRERHYGTPKKKASVPASPDTDAQAELDAASESEVRPDGEIPSDETFEEQMARITEDYNRRAAKDTPIGDPSANGTGQVEKSPLPRGWPEPISAADLCANPPPRPEVLIEGILYAAGTMLVAGPSKSMKTFSALDVALAIASGGKWMGRQCTQSSVLYLNLELQDFATEERIARICSARGIQPPANFHTWNLRGQTVSLAALVACLPDCIARYKCKIVCIDPHYKISSVSDMEENSNDSQGKLLTLLEGLCCRAGAALTITHHFAKGDASNKNAIDRASGGGVFARWGDVMMTFTPHKEGDAMTVEMSLRNFAPIEPFVVQWEYPRWIRNDDLDPADLKTSRGPKEKHSPESLLRVLGDKLFTYSEWLKASKLPPSTFKRKRDELIDDGEVVQVGLVYRKKQA